ncbi:MAG: hypothetical protein GY832_23295 [Chloroflexi bacterium]|nr:hypothetical protein [Chloroflexota bacterium]
MKNNPYVGPRPYERTDQGNFYGRKREARDLLSLVLAERIVLFYAPSGAGKTSLLNAQVIPALEEDDFRVLPATRVGSDLPPRIDSQDVENIFVFSALMGLAGEKVPVETLTSHTILSFLRQFCPEEKEGTDDTPPILILDQFEEILTTHRDRWQDARGFFEQMRKALRGMPSLGVVFSMREDYVAGMDPYASILPRRLRARFRMERLDRRGALEAMKKPAQNAGCSFDTGVAERLVDDLRRIKVARDSTQSLDDQESTVLGPFVEPVQLQVVCNRLWENLPEQEDNIIQQEEVEEFGNVDRALTDFYENALTQCVKETDVGERQLRRWFDEYLITPMQTRGLVLRGESETNGLPNEAVDVLSNRHLIRADVRAGARWYELSHDRMVDPIIASNRAWNVARETPLRMTAKRWQETRDDDLVYRDKALAEALIWSKSHPDEAEPYELEFLEVSQKAQRGRNRSRLLRTLVIILMAIGIVVTAWSAYAAGRDKIRAQQAEAAAIAAQDEAEIKRQEAEEAWAQAETDRQAAQTAQTAAEENQLEAERQARLALSEQMAAQAQTILEESPQRSLLLSLEALNVTLQVGESRVPAAENSLRQALSSVGSTLLVGHEKDVRAVKFSSDGQWLATASSDGTVRLWRVDDPDDIVVLRGGEETIQSLAVSSDGQWLATGDEAGTISLWRMDDLTKEPMTLAEQDSPVYVVAFSPDAGQLAAGREDGVVQLWKMDDPTADPVMVEEVENSIKAMAFSPDGRWLAVGVDDGTVQLWQVDEAEEGPVILEGHQDVVDLVIFSPDGLWLATASWDGSARLWDASQIFDPRIDETDVDSVELEHFGMVRAMAFSSDGRRLATGGDDRMVRMWDFSMMSGDESPLPTESDEESPPPRESDEESLPLTESSTGENLQFPPPDIRYGHEESIETIAFDPDGHWLATGSLDRTVRLWMVENPGAEAVVLRGHEAPVSTVAFSPDGYWLATGGNDKTANLWEMDNLSPEPAVLRGHEEHINAVAFSPDGRWLATGGSDRRIDLWDMSDPKVDPIVLSGDEWDVNAVEFSPDGLWLVAGSRDGAARLWGVSALVETGESDPVAELEVSREDDIAAVSVAFSSGSDRLVVWSDDVVARLWDMSDLAAEPVELRGHTDAIHAAAFSPDGRWLATGDLGGEARLWDLNDLTANPTILAWHEDMITAMAFSPDGRWLATASQGSAMLWNLEDPAEESMELYGYKSFIAQIAFSLDGRWLALGGYSRTVHLWDMNDLEKGSVTLAGHESPVTAIAFNSDGSWLATGSTDHTARLWDMSDPSTDPVVLSGHENSVESVAFSPDGRWLATGSRDNTVRLWTLSLDELIELSCLSAGRNLTYEEWQWYVRQGNELYQKTCDSLPVSSTAIDEAISQAEDSAVAGNTDTASLMYEQAQQWADEISVAWYHYEVCWSGSVYGFAQVVITSCDRAVELEPEEQVHYYSRGLARALTGDYAGAAEDLSTALTQWEEEEEEGFNPEEFQDWIATLETGQNPFTKEALETLR